MSAAARLGLVVLTLAILLGLLADWLLRASLERRHGTVALDPLDDALEGEAHRVAERIAAAG